VRIVFWLALLTLLPGEVRAWTHCKGQPLPRASLAQVGLDAALGADLDALLRDAVEGKLTASAALAVGRRGKLAYAGYVGKARPDSVFDLASVTKAVATTTAVLQLVERKRLSLADTVSRHLPLLDVDDKRAITVEQLLMHTSGLHSSVYAGPLTDGRDKLLERIRRSVMKGQPGSAFRYSDIGYMVLGELVAAVSKKTLDQVVESQLLEPLGMCGSGYRPPPAVRSRLISPWPAREEQKLGVVYDPLAARAGGVAGHASLYATAEDLVRYGLMVLGRGQLGGKRVLAEPTVALMMNPHPLPSGNVRGLGWMIANRGGPFSARAVGHGGFTGTSIWIDSELDLVVVLLTNRTHLADPGGAHAPNVFPLQRRVHQTIVGALARPPKQAVETGLDRLVAGSFATLRGRKVGLISNRTAVDRRGRWIGDLLLEPSSGVELAALFVPEHGLDGKVDRRIKDGLLTRGERRVPIYSLFSARRRPDDKSLAGVDTLVIDLATVGVRYYTYLATMGWAMEEAARRKLRFVVLDRPNPLGGEKVQGPVSSAERRTSTNYHPLPVRYGMTLGELAGYYKAERRIAVQLEVIRAQGWARRATALETGLEWIDPSPNIRSFRQALLYGGIGLLESTRLAVGRGTPWPFQVVGAPWLDGKALAAALNRRPLAGVRAVAESFTPKEGPYRNERCSGARLVILDPRLVNPPAVGAAIAVELHRTHAADWETKNLYRLINHPPTTDAILAGKDLPAVEAAWRPGLARFLALRQKHLLYR
jgi:uncharacterized protein YbbC (DUF1343 family)